MMLHHLIDEVRNRRVLVLAALAVIVALALPLLFLKGAPAGAPAADTAAPAAAQEAKLPARAARLLATTDAAAVKGHASGRSADPFSPPASYRAAVAAAAAKGAGTPAPKATSDTPKAGAGPTPGTKNNPIVITNADNKAGDTATSNQSDATPSTAKARPARSVAVDVRFGKQKDSKIRRAIAPNQGFYIHGRLVAMFVNYSPSRNRAVFAVAPGLHISGPNACRVVNNVCRYLDIRAGSHARLTTILDNRSVVSRRLDVVHTRTRHASGATRATAAGSSADGACLLRKLRAMVPGDALLDRDACER
jgi:hypothetical protein